MIRTPPLSTSILPGITRDAVITIAQRPGLRRRGGTADPLRPLPRGRVLHDRNGGRGDAGACRRRPGARRRAHDEGDPGVAYLDTVNGRTDRWSHWLDVVDVVPLKHPPRAKACERLFPHTRRRRGGNSAKACERLFPHTRRRRGGNSAKACRAACAGRAAARGSRRCGSSRRARRARRGRDGTRGRSRAASARTCARPRACRRPAARGRGSACAGPSRSAASSRRPASGCSEKRANVLTNLLCDLVGGRAPSTATMRSWCRAASARYASSTRRMKLVALALDPVGLARRRAAAPRPRRAARGTCGRAAGRA